MNQTVHHRHKSVRAQGILPLCLCLVVGVSVLPHPSYAQSRDVLNRLERMEKEMETLNRAVYKGERPPASGGGGGSDVAANVELRIGHMETEIRNLTGKVEQQSYDIQQLQQKIDGLEMDSRMRLDAVEAQLRNRGGAPVAGGQPQPMVDTNTIPPMAPDGTPAVLQPDPAAANNSGMVTGAETGATDAAGLYERGFGQIKQQDYAAAESSFSSFLKQYPTHALAPNALYWLGETYYVRKDYTKASRAFAEAYQKYPNGPKGADNLLKLGMSLAGQGQKDNACIALKQLRKEYATGPEPVLARGDQEMVTLGCS